MFPWPIFIKVTRLSQELFMSKFQYQNSTKLSSVASVKFIKTKFIFRYRAKGVSIKFHQIRITKLNFIDVQIPVPKWKKTKKSKKSSGLQIGARGITNRGSFRDFKLWQKDYKSGQRNFKLGQRLQIEVRGITNWCSTICRDLYFYIEPLIRITKSFFCQHSPTQIVPFPAKLSGHGPHLKVPT